MPDASRLGQRARKYPTRASLRRTPVAYACRPNARTLGAWRGAARACRIRGGRSNRARSRRTCGACRIDARPLLLDADKPCGASRRARRATRGLHGQSAAQALCRWFPARIEAPPMGDHSRRNQRDDLRPRGIASGDSPPKAARTLHALFAAQAHLSRRLRQCSERHPGRCSTHRCGERACPCA